MTDDQRDPDKRNAIDRATTRYPGRGWTAAEEAEARRLHDPDRADAADATGPGSDGADERRDRGTPDRNSDRGRD
jgi:hypothetical protein